MNRAIGRRIIPRLVLLGALWAGNVYAGHKWEATPEEHLNAKPANSETEDAGAELLLVKRSVEFDDRGLVWGKFFRAKVYAARAAEQIGRIRILLNSNAELSDCGARIIRDGAVIREYGLKDFPKIKAVERLGGLGSASYYVDDTSEIQATGVLLHQLQITDLQPGDLVEFFQQVDQLMDAQEGYAAQILENMQEEWPIRTLEFAIIRDSGKMDRYNWNMTACNIPQTTRKKTDGGMILVGKDLPAYRAEKDRLPDKDNRAYIILQATSGNLEALFTNWDEYVGWVYADTDSACRPNSAMKKLAAKLVAGDATAKEKLKKLHDYCQRSIANIDYETVPEWKKTPLADRRSWTAADTLEKGYGPARTVNCLFVALAKAAGMEATLALTTHGKDMLRADRVACGWLFMNGTAAAVKQGEKWVYYSPGMRWAPFGQWYWQDQGTAVLLAKKGKPHWEVRPIINDPAQDRLSREGRFKLTEQGVLTGEITETLSGQTGMIWRHQYKGFNQEKLRQVVLKRGKNNYPQAKVSAVTIEDDRDNTHPVVLNYSVTIPNFATRAGERITFAPNVLRARFKPRYTDEQARLGSIRFQYGLITHDKLEIALPEGYELEAGAAPKPVDYMDVAGIKQSTKLGYLPKKGVLLSECTLAIGQNEKIMFPAKAYAALKQVFEEVNRAEIHTLVLKPKPGYVSKSAEPGPAENLSAETAANDDVVADAKKDDPL